MLSAVCPHCSKEVKYERQHVGRTGKCPSCGQKVQLPPPADVEQAEAPEESFDFSPATMGPDPTEEQLLATANPAANDDGENSGNRPNAAQIGVQVALWLIVALLAIDIAKDDVAKVRIVHDEPWEYKIEHPSDILFESEMNRFGKDGWELVFARRARDAVLDKIEYEVIMKRRK